MSALIPVLVVILAIVVTVLAFVFIVPEKKRAKLNKFGRFLHDTVNFKYLIVEKILQALYIFATAAVILLGFFMLFYVQPGYESRHHSIAPVWYGGYGLLTMVLGPIAVRLAYEFLMMFILLIKNVIQINNKLQGTGNDGKETPPEDVQPAAAQPDYSANPFNVIPTYSTPVAPVAPVAPVEPVAPVAPVEPVAPAEPVYTAAPAVAPSFCPNCGTKCEDGPFCPNCGTKL